MKKFYYLISFIVVLFISSNNVYSQIDDWIDYSLDCDDFYDIPDTSVKDVIYDSRNGYSYSPHGVIRFLAVFVELEYDNPEDDPFLNGTQYWSVGSLPIWANQLFAAYDTSDFSSKQVTKYYRYASSNNHIVLGDYLLAPDNGGVLK